MRIWKESSGCNEYQFFVLIESFLKFACSHDHIIHEYSVPISPDALSTYIVERIAAQQISPSHIQLKDIALYGTAKTPNRIYSPETQDNLFLPNLTITKSKIISSHIIKAAPGINTDAVVVGGKARIIKCYNAECVVAQQPEDRTSTSGGTTTSEALVTLYGPQSYVLLASRYEKVEITPQGVIETYIDFSEGDKLLGLSL